MSRLGKKIDRKLEELSTCPGVGTTPRPVCPAVTAATGAVRAGRTGE